MAIPLTSKKLRDNMEDIVNAVKNGEEFLFIYRSEPVFRIVPVEGDGTEPYILRSPSARCSSHEREYTKEEKKKIIEAVRGIGAADDIEGPEKDKEILRKRLIEKHVNRPKQSVS
jgi:antitoxin (DNA-binding transcriptional repressor) of toxin-antitoxin stability system